MESVSPVKKHCKAAITTNPQTIRVGKLGTKPVLTYVPTTGTKNIKAITNNTKAIVVKNLKGL